MKRQVSKDGTECNEDPAGNEVQGIRIRARSVETAACLMYSSDYRYAVSCWW